jgi:hypothetical protein
MADINDHIAISKRCEALSTIVQATTIVIVDTMNTGNSTNIEEAKNVQELALKELKHMLEA